MPAINLDCDVKQGYDFKKDSKATVGYITEMIIGGQTLAGDQTIKDPLSPDMTLGAVAVLSSASWKTGPTNPMYFTGQISAANMHTIRAFMTKGDEDISVRFKFVCYAYDFTAGKMGKMFKSYHSGDTQIQGLIEKKRNELSLHVDTDPLAYPPTPTTFPISIGIIPGDREQPVHLATSDTDKLALPWGTS
jgi:hypothetical protein